LADDDLGLFTEQYHRAQRDSIVPLAGPVVCVDGTAKDAILVPKGTTCVINIAGVNRDPQIWGSDALEWKPERWLLPLPESIAKAQVPTLYANT
jgi:cytochrome P450